MGEVVQPYPPLGQEPTFPGKHPASLLGSMGQGLYNMVGFCGAEQKRVVYQYVLIIYCVSCKLNILGNQAASTDASSEDRDGEDSTSPQGNAEPPTGASLSSQMNLEPNNCLLFLELRLTFPFLLFPL